MSPHFGRMDADRMSPEDALLMRAKLHWSSGLQRLRGNRIPNGILTVYDALLSGMRWYILVHLRHEPEEGLQKKLEDEEYLFSLLRDHGLIDRTSDLDHLLEAVDRVLRDQEPGADTERIVSGLTKFLTRLGVLPFDEAELPPEP
jgi:uncharacterized protein (DUF2267 family)